MIDWLAHQLIERGVSQGDYVAIVFPICIQHVVATMGTYKAGGTPKPISYRMPSAGREAFLELANLKCAKRVRKDYHIGQSGLSDKIF